jgi:cell division septation protein DedD
MWVRVNLRCLGHRVLGYGCGAQESQPGQYSDLFNGVTGLDGLPNKPPSSSQNNTSNQSPTLKTLKSDDTATNPQRPVAACKLPPARVLPRASTTTPSTPQASEKSNADIKSLTTPARLSPLASPAPRPALKTWSPCTLHGLDRAQLGSLGCTRLWPRTPLAMQRPPPKEVPLRGHG